MKRVVLDTNILVSGIFWGGPPRKVYELASDRLIVPLSTPALLAELHRVVHYPKFQSTLNQRNLTPRQIMDRYQAMVEMVTPAEVAEDVIRDSDDVHVLACGVGGQADYIVSGDDDLISLHIFRGIPIIGAVRLIEMLQTPDTD